MWSGISIPREARTTPLCHKDNHLTKYWGYLSEENQKAPRVCRRIWFPNLRITLSATVSLSSCYEMRYPYTQNINQQPKHPWQPTRCCCRRRPCSFVQTVWEGRSRARDHEAQHRHFTDEMMDRWLGPSDCSLGLRTQCSFLQLQWFSRFPSLSRGCRNCLGSYPGLCQWVRSILLSRNTLIWTR